MTSVDTGIRTIQPARLRALSWLALLATLAGTGTAIGFAYTKQKHAGEERAAVGAAEHLAHHVAEVDAAEWEAIARGDRESLSAAREASLRVLAAQRRFSQAAGGATRLRRVAASYAAALDGELDLLAAKRSAAARRVYARRVDPAFVALRSQVDRVSARQEHVADSTAHVAGLLTKVAAALGALTLVALLGQVAVQRRMLEREREQLEELQSLDRLKDEFVASVSHELRTPLTSIRGYLELVLEGEAGELTQEQENFLRIVERNAKRLLHLVADLLDVAQIESGRLVLDLAEEELTRFVSESVEAARPLASGRGIELSLHRNGPAHVSVDRTRLAQVLDNLLSNALKFTEAGGAVDVTLSKRNGSAIVEVADTGMGMSREEQTNLFQRFYRTAAAGEKAIPGTGLGLWISKAIVEAHGGEIAVESAIGRGTTFRVELPTTEEHQ